MSGNGKRPLGVSLVFVVILISGVLAVVAGIWRLFNRGDDIGWIAALVVILLGLIYLLVAKGIANGSRGARFVVAIVTVLSIVAATWSMILQPSVWVTAVIQILLGLIVLGLLYNARARQFFGA